MNWRDDRENVGWKRTRCGGFHWISSFALTYLFLYGTRQDTKRSLADSLANFVSMDKATVCLQYCSLYQIRDQVVSLCWHWHNRCWWIESVLSFIFRSLLRRWKNEMNSAMKFHVVLADGSTILLRDATAVGGLKNSTYFIRETNFVFYSYSFYNIVKNILRKHERQYFIVL